MAEDRNFMETLQTIHRGELVDQCEEEMPKLLAQIQDRGGAGSMTIKINFKPKGNRVEVDATVSTKSPKVKLPASIFYLNPQNQLQRNDPAQAEMYAEQD